MNTARYGRMLLADLREEKVEKEKRMMYFYDKNIDTHSNECANPHMHTLTNMHMQQTIYSP